jgi:hypothetical protein
MVVCIAAGAAAQTADDAAKALAGRGDLDEIRWSDPAKGVAFRAGVVRAIPEGMEVQRGAVRRVLPYDQVGGVKFGVSMGERQLMAAAKPESIPALRVFWEARRLTIQLAGSNAGDFGLALARALRRADLCDEALTIAQTIADQDNDSLRRGQAKLECETLTFLQSMRTDAAEVVEGKAWALIEAASEGNPDLMLLVTGYLMKKEFEALKSIEADNPRWMEDDEVKPERERHYHRALDLALYPSLFHPTREVESAEGLWQASKIYQYTKETAREAGVLEDLVALYANSAPAVEARQRLVPLRARLETGKTAADSPAEAEKPKEEPTKQPPPPPKRYNLFED